MRLVQYLPSSQFAAVALSIALAGGLIIAAQYLTRPPQLASSVQVKDSGLNENWQEALLEAQANTSLPEPPNPETVQALLEAAESTNLTDSVARSLLIQLSDAGAQGLGSDLPTQEKIIEAATQKIDAAAPKQVYVAADLRSVADTPEAKKAYGNAVMEILARHQRANSSDVLKALALATDNANPAELAPLKAIGAEYDALVAELANVRVPRTLTPLHIKILNGLSASAAHVEDISLVFKDPLRSLQSLKAYQDALGEVGRVFTSIAEQFERGGILFTKDEPGAAWSVFLST